MKEVAGGTGRVAGVWQGGDVYIHGDRNVCQDEEHALSTHDYTNSPDATIEKPPYKLWRSCNVPTRNFVVILTFIGDRRFLCFLHQGLNPICWLIIHAGQFGI